MLLMVTSPLVKGLSSPGSPDGQESVVLGLVLRVERGL